MDKNKIIQVICKMAEDNNSGLLMTTTVLNAKTINDVSEVDFRVERRVTSSAVC